MGRHHKYCRGKEWDAFRKHLLMRRGYRCERCQLATARLELHHTRELWRYGRSAERFAAGDLQRGQDRDFMPWVSHCRDGARGRGAKAQAAGGGYPWCKRMGNRGSQAH